MRGHGPAHWVKMMSPTHACPRNPARETACPSWLVRLKSATAEYTGKALVAVAVEFSFPKANRRTRVSASNSKPPKTSAEDFCGSGFISPNAESHDANARPAG